MIESKVPLLLTIQHLVDAWSPAEQCCNGSDISRIAHIHVCQLMIGNGKRHLVPNWQPAGTGKAGGEGRRYGRKHRGQRFLTRHTGLPPKADGRE